MNVVLIVPTGIGCEIGGHAGDANPVAKLIGKCCDKLVTHPNVVNASDINEMPENTFYVDGSTLDRFLRGEIYLRERFFNRILIVVNNIDSNNQNAIHAANSTIGADISLIQLQTPLKMKASFDSNGKAGGEVTGWRELCEQVETMDCEVLGIQSYIEVDENVKENYFKNGGINPWGGIEAIASKLISDKLDKVVAHAPYLTSEQLAEDDKKYGTIVTDPRMSAEMISNCYIHCILKGLHKAPKIDYDHGMSVSDIDFMISPHNCWGEAHMACEDNDIPIIMVKENRNIYSHSDILVNDRNYIEVDNYIEAAGLLMAYKAGVNPKTVRRK